MNLHSDLEGLDDALENADLETLREIVREAEAFLDAQLQAGIAADQRAITFASVLGAVVAVMLGGFFAGLAGDLDLSIAGYFVLPVTIGFTVAMALAFWTSAPVDWGFAGNNPALWRAEIEAKKPLNHSLAGQASLYAKAIRTNRDILNRNAKLINWAFAVAGVAVAAASCATFVAVFVNAEGG